MRSVSLNSDGFYELDPVETRACFLSWFYRTSPACGSVVVERSSSFSVQLWARSDEQTELLWPSKIPEQPPPFVHPDRFPIKQLSLRRPCCSLHACVGRLSQLSDSDTNQAWTRCLAPALLVFSSSPVAARRSMLPACRDGGSSSSQKCRKSFQ